jgi:hypothetical protein
MGVGHPQSESPPRDRPLARRPESCQRSRSDNTPMGIPNESQCHDRRTAHRVDVADGVGGCNPTKVERVIHDRHEEIGRCDERLLIIRRR